MRHPPKMAAGPMHSLRLHLQTLTKEEEIREMRVIMIKRIKEVGGGGGLGERKASANNCQKAD